MIRNDWFDNFFMAEFFTYGESKSTPREIFQKMQSPDTLDLSPNNSFLSLIDHEYSERILSFSETPVAWVQILDILSKQLLPNQRHSKPPGNFHSNHQRGDKNPLLGYCKRKKRNNENQPEKDP